MPDRTPIVRPQQMNRLGRPLGAGARARAGNATPETEPARDSKQFIALGRKNSRVRRLDSRGSANK